MEIFAQIKRLAAIVWKESGAGWFWATISSLPPVLEIIRSHWNAFDPMIGAVEWWWGLVILAIWIIFGLAQRVLRQETPALALEVIQDQRDKSWWIEVRNTGSKALTDCAVDFERIENASGTRVFPHSFGLLRSVSQKRSNPFPLRPTQPKQGLFAQLQDNKIVILGMSIDWAVTSIELEEEKYSVVVGAYSELDGAQCKKTLTLLRKDGLLLVS